MTRRLGYRISNPPPSFLVALVLGDHHGEPGRIHDFQMREVELDLVDPIA